MHTIDPSELINTGTVSAGGVMAARAAWESYAYYEMRPYPTFAFMAAQWPLDKGPRPTPLPYAQILIDEGAEFVFRNGSPSFSVPDDLAADALLDKVIQQNALSTRWVPLSVRTGHLGTMAVKWSYDGDDTDCPVRLSFLSVPEECRVWMDPHDRTKLLMARIQYPYRSPSDGKWYYYREEWTAEEWVVYQPKFAGDATFMSAMELPGYMNNLGDGTAESAGEWTIESQSTNDFGIIPVTLIRNREIDGYPLGVGDVWNSFRLMDRIALTMHGEDRANQLHSEPIPVIENATLKNTGPLLPGEPIEVQNSNRDGPPAVVHLLEPSGAARQYSHLTIEKWEALLYAQVGLSLVDAAAVTNKGNMTRAVFEMLYARTIATSNRKRSNWGEGGMAKFFRNMLTGLSNAGVITGFSVGDDLSITVKWPDYFDATADDIKAISDRSIGQMQAGVLSQDRTARRIATAEGVPPHEQDKLVKELPDPASASAADPNAPPTPTAPVDGTATDEPVPVDPVAFRSKYAQEVQARRGASVAQK